MSTSRTCVARSRTTRRNRAASSRFGGPATCSPTCEQALTDSEPYAHGAARTLVVVALLDVRFNTYRLGEDVSVVGIAGELDLYAAEEMQERLGEIVEGGARSVVLDLLGAGFLD